MTGAAALMSLAIACSAAPEDRRTAPSPASAVTPTPATASVSLPSPEAGSGHQTAASDDEDAGPADAGSVKPSLTADAAGPFGEPDLWIGAGPPAVGLQRSLGPGDLPGPLLKLPYGGVGLFRVFDMCGYTEASFREGGDFASVVYRFGYDTARRFHKGCSQSRFMAIAISRWIDNERRYFRWRNQAEAWLVEPQRGHYAASAAARSNSNRLPGNVYVTGFADNLTDGTRGRFGLAFAPADAPVDEVRVLPKTVAVSGGVLRGLVRNWSRHLWAYAVTVTAEGHEFMWPLAIQPGEVAPFELHGWDGPTDPAQMQVTVAASMSWHTNPSRAFAYWYAGEAPMLWVGPHARRTMSDAVRDRYQHVTADTVPGSVSEGTVSWNVAPIEPSGSHPSLADDLETLVVEDFRAYGAAFDRAGRVVEVGPGEILDTSAWSPYDELFGADASPAEIISSLSGLEDLRAQVMSVRFDVHKAGVATDVSRVKWPEGGIKSPADFYERDGYEARGAVEGGFILWIGAAQPELDSNTR